MNTIYLFVFALIYYMTPNQVLVEGSDQSKKQVIVVSLPGKSDVQYLNNLQYLANFAMEMDEKTEDKDQLFIIHDESGLDLFRNHTFKNAYLIKVEHSLDMWMRDFPPCMPKQQIKFKYLPQYIPKARAKLDERNFEKFAKMVGLPTLEQSNLVLEGGNIVENGYDAAITTARVYEDNPDMTEEEFVLRLEARINRKVAVIPDPQDTTGHADGVVIFAEDDVLLVAYYEDDPDGPGFYEDMTDAILKVFPNLTIVPLPSYARKGKSQGFVSAEGSYANSLVTNNAVYLPFFSNETGNERVLRVFKKSTSKEVVPVYSAGKVPTLGGSLRCMTWQIDRDHPVAKSLFKYLEKRGGSSAVSGLTGLVMLSVQLFFLLAYLH